jgi:hypothetical protein
MASGEALSAAKKKPVSESETGFFFAMCRAKLYSYSHMGT